MKEMQNGSVKPGQKRSRETYKADLAAGASTEAKRRMAAILEVLGGARTPGAAAEAIEVSLPRYYLLEVQALQGMLAACEPRNSGRVQTSESALAALQRECEQLRRENIRQQALVRAAQRTVGLTPPSPPPKENGKKRRRRRPMVRALRAVARLKDSEQPVVAATTATP